jgi:CDGSH iron-sulfur domain-containing protein 3
MSRSTPVVAQKSPFEMDLKAGDYWWCACGLSKNQPFCDGSHKPTTITPRKFTVDADKKVWLCGCKATKNTPFCDGTHNKI